MIDLRYHIASLIGIFLALGLGILIGSTIVGDNLLVDQQKKMIDRLEDQFNILRERETKLVDENEYKNRIIANYENYSQALLPPLVKDRLTGYRVAIVVSGDSEIPAGMLNALSIAGAEVVTKTVILSNMKLDKKQICNKLMDYYGINYNSTTSSLRKYIAESVGAIILNKGDPALMKLLQENDIVKFSGDNSIPINGVILMGGCNNLKNLFAESFDQILITYLNNQNIKVFGVENSEVIYSYMEDYQETTINTIDNIDLSPGQISLVFAMEGEPGHYGIKPTAQKFMPSLPVDTITGR